MSTSTATSAAHAAPAQNNRASLGVLLILGSAVAFSTAGLFTRLIALDTWTILVWRGLFAAAFILCCIIARHGRGTVAAFRAIGTAGIAASACSAAGTICFISALRLTSVADVTLIFATAPFAAAAIAWLWAGERASRVTLAASLGALCGVIVIFGSAWRTGQVAGYVLALAATVTIAATMVIIRRRNDRSFLPAACLSAFVSAIVVLPASHPGVVGTGTLFYLALFGITQLGLGLLLLMLGARLISASQSALIGTLEVPLAPLWVWLAFGEIPSWMTFVGGAIIAVAVLSDILLNTGRQPD
ncbi:MAG TPA: DMT family transporter [Acetobacteraceae bacterium]